MAKQKKKSSLVSKKSTKKESPQNFSFKDTKDKWVYLVFTTLAFIIYGITYNFGYVLDDTIVITENNFVKKGLSGIPELLTTESFSGYFGKQMDLVQGARYRPLSLITFAIEYQIYELKPWFSHLLNVLLYACCGMLVYRTLKLFKLEKDSKFWLSIPFIASLIFLVHPLHVEAIANIKGRDEILAFLFSIATLFYFIKYHDTQKIVNLMLAIVMYFIGLLAKESTITFLAIVPVSIYFFRPDSLKSALKVFSILLAVSLIYLLIRYQVIGYFLSSGKEIADVMNNPFIGMTTAQEFATIFHTLGVYLKLHLIPYPLTHDYYPYHIPISNFSDLRAIVPLIIHLILGLIALWGLRGKKVYAFCILFYFIALSIVSNLVVSVGTFMNERFVFCASLGFCLLIAYYSKKAYNTERPVLKWSALSLLTLMILAYSFISINRVPVWENALSLNKAAVKVSKNSARSNSFMATALYNKYQESQDREEKKKLIYEAEVYANQAVKILPAYKNANLMKVGVATEVYKYDNDLDKMLNTFKEVIKVRPDIDHIKNYIEYFSNRGYNAKVMRFLHESATQILMPQGRYDWAVYYLNFAYAMDSKDARILEAMAVCYQASGNPEAAANYRNQIK